LGWKESVNLLESLAESVRARRQMRLNDET